MSTQKNTQILGGFTAKTSVQEAQQKETASFTVRLESGVLAEDLPIPKNNKFDLYVRLFIKDQIYKTPVSVDCNRKPSWGREAVYNFFESRILDGDYAMQFEVWNYATEIGDVLICSGQLDILSVFNKARAQKVILYGKEVQDKNGLDQSVKQAGYLQIAVEFSQFFKGKPTQDVSNSSNAPLNKPKGPRQKYQFTEPVLPEGYKISQKEVEEKRATFEQKMQMFRQKYQIPEKKKE